MKPVKFCVVDAFTSTPFKGNPAAVCLLEEYRDDEWLQEVACEFNQPITCFLARLSDDSAGSVSRFRIRWFTRVLEVKLCGHATIAASHFLFARNLVKSDMIEFVSTHSGTLTARRIEAAELPSDLSKPNGGDFLIELDFPAFTLYSDTSIEVSSVSKSLNGASVNEVLTTSADILGVLASGEEVAKVTPNFNEILKFPNKYRGIIITGTAPAGSRFDIFSRFFSPIEGIDEDQVCGSAHCALAPYWTKKLGKCDLIAYQASQRGGVLNLHFDEKNGRVIIRGAGAAVMEGSLLV